MDFKALAKHLSLRFLYHDQGFSLHAIIRTPLLRMWRWVSAQDAEIGVKNDAIFSEMIIIFPAQHERDEEGEDAKALARMLFDTALLESGFTIEAPKEFNSRIYTLLARSLGIKRDVTTAPEVADSKEVETPCATP